MEIWLEVPRADGKKDASLRGGDRWGEKTNWSSEVELVAEPAEEAEEFERLRRRRLSPSLAAPAAACGGGAPGLRVAERLQCVGEQDIVTDRGGGRKMRLATSSRTCGWAVRGLGQLPGSAREGRGVHQGQLGRCD